MNRTLRVSALISGAFGLVVAAAGSSLAQTRHAPADGWGRGYGGPGSHGFHSSGFIDNDTIADFRIFFHCSPSTRTCVDGPVNSGGLWRSQNLWWKSGPVVDSGSPWNTNGNVNGDTETHGPQGPKDIQVVR